MTKCEAKAATGNQCRLPGSDRVGAWDLCHLHASRMREGKTVEMVDGTLVPPKPSDFYTDTQPEPDFYGEPEPEPEPSADLESAPTPIEEAIAAAEADPDVHALGEIDLPDESELFDAPDAAEADKGQSDRGAPPAKTTGAVRWTPEQTGKVIGDVLDMVFRRIGADPTSQFERELLGAGWAPLANEYAAYIDPESPWGAAIASTIAFAGMRAVSVDRTKAEPAAELGPSANSGGPEPEPEPPAGRSGPSWAQ